MSQHVPAPDAVAIIGMAARLPGADTVSAYWDNLVAGRDAVSAPATANSSPAAPHGVLAGADLFDAEFFGFSPLEARRTDPQHRLMLEVTWHALEHAGYGAVRGRPVTGVYAGSSTNTYLLDVLASQRHRGDLDDSQLLIGCDKDYLATRVAHRLDLRGPAVVVQSACSTSLVAVHYAVQGLLAGECDLAVAGGVSVRGTGRAAGTRASRADGMVSPDGRCRAFDAAASGMVPGDGIGLVVLRRLDDALEHGDRVHAVIRGSAVNNDGAGKAGYTAPSVAGQTAVVAAALAVAGVRPDSIGYVEAHGTGTRLGDPIEVAALAEAFGETGHRCALGSVKTNIGHLDAAAGVASLIKATLAVEHGLIPPTIHFERPNPELRLERTPFHVPTEVERWPVPVGPRRAAVSSFGIGGTNAHVIIEGAPAPAPAGGHRPWQIVPVSARTGAALRQATANLTTALAGLAGAEFADAAATLRTGRQHFDHRTAVVAESGARAAALLGDAGASLAAGSGHPVGLLFPGQGAQYLGMAGHLRTVHPRFCAELDACVAAVGAAGVDLSPVLDHATGPAGAEPDQDRSALLRTELVQPALFAVEYALAQLLIECGVEPAALLGHSVGELVAACVAGVLSRTDAARLVVARGRAMAAAGPGAMLAIAAPAGELSWLREQDHPVDIAAVNAPAQTVVAGEPDAVAAVAVRCRERGLRCRQLRTAHAFHSAAMEAAALAVAAAAAEVSLAAPRRPVLSNVSGDWLTAEQATDPGYWGRQVRATVRFADGLRALAERGPHLLVEVGPGRTLTDLVTAHGPDAGLGRPLGTVLPTGEHNGATPAGTAEPYGLLRVVADLWTAGVPIRWTALHEQRRRRAALPGYPFQRQRYHVAGDAEDADAPLLPAGTDQAMPNGDQAMPNGEQAMSDSEQVVAEVWQRLLGVPHVGRDQSFFELGGHSLLGMQVLDELSAMFGVELPVAQLYERPTVAELAAAVEHAVIDSLEPPAGAAPPGTAEPEG